MRVTWENGKLLYITNTLKYDRKGGFRTRIERLHPPPEAWERFWKALDAAGVWKWQPLYMGGPPCCDDAGYSVELRHAGHSMKSEGNYDRPPAFDAFRNAVDQLIKDSQSNHIKVSNWSAPPDQRCSRSALIRVNPR